MRMLRVSYKKIVFSLMALATKLKTNQYKIIPQLNFGVLSSFVCPIFKLLVKKSKMVSIKFFVLLVAVSCESKKSLLPQAILQLVQSNYGDRSVVIEVFYNSKNVKILGETLKLLSNVKQLKVTPISYRELILMEPEEFEKGFFNPQHINRQNDAIFLFDSLYVYSVWKDRIVDYLTYLRRSNLNHLVYCKDASQEDIKLFIKRDVYESFLVEENDKVSLHAMTMFTEKKCRPEQLVEINQFSSLKSKWETEKFFRPRIENFHGCKLWFELNWMETKMPFMTKQKHEGDTGVEGVIIDLLDTLSTHLNFTYVYGQPAREYFSDVESREYSEYINTYDILVGATMLEGLGNPSSYSIYSTADVCVVPPGENFTSWEKLLMPFDRPTWMWLGIVFAVAFLVILLIKWSKSTSVHEFVIGSNVTTPALNVIAIFMGIGQISLPQTNVTRFFFMVFILFSLIMRTAYQGKYFEFLTSDMRRKPIQTIDELKDKNFTAIVDFFHCLTFLCENDLLER